MYKQGLIRRSRAVREIRDAAAYSIEYYRRRLTSAEAIDVLEELENAGPSDADTIDRPAAEQAISEAENRKVLERGRGLKPSEIVRVLEGDFSCPA